MFQQLHDTNSVVQKSDGQTDKTTYLAQGSENYSVVNYIA